MRRPRSQPITLDWLLSQCVPEPNSGCWIWLKALDSKGYGNLCVGARKFIGAHRLAYQLHTGRDCDGLDIDHRCRVRSCINPLHLEAVSHRENMLRGDTLAAKLARRTVCPKGHLLSGENLFQTDKFRRCRQCAADRARAFRAARRNGG